MNQYTILIFFKEYWEAVTAIIVKAVLVPIDTGTTILVYNRIFVNELFAFIIIVPEAGTVIDSLQDYVVFVAVQEVKIDRLPVWILRQTFFILQFDFLLYHEIVLEALQESEESMLRLNVFDIDLEGIAFYKI